MNTHMPFIIPILVSALATFLVRILPYYVTFLDRLPPFLSRSLRLLPIAALGPLIFPGVIMDFPSRWYAGLVAVMVSSAIAYRRSGMVLPILSSILVTYLLLL